MIDLAWKKTSQAAWEWRTVPNLDPASIQDDDEVRRLYLENWLGDRGYDAYQLISDPTYARRSALREWLKDNGYEADKLLVFEDSSFNLAERKEFDQAVLLRLLAPVAGGPGRRCNGFARYGASGQGRGNQPCQGYP